MEQIFILILFFLFILILCDVPIIIEVFTPLRVESEVSSNIHQLLIFLYGAWVSEISPGPKYQEALFACHIRPRALKKAPNPVKLSSKGDSSKGETN